MHTTPPDLDVNTLHREALAREIMPIWTIYRHPADYPQGYVARLFAITAGKSGPTGNAIYADTLDEVRRSLPPGLWRMRRMDGDQPQIVETWL